MTLIGSSPVRRMQSELNVEARLRGDGTVGVYFPDGNVVELIKEQWLAFTKYEDLWPIRQQLAYSHRQGRPSICPRAAPAHVVYCNHCVASTQTEEDTTWSSWLDPKVHADEYLSSFETPWLASTNHMGC